MSDAKVTKDGAITLNGFFKATLMGFATVVVGSMSYIGTNVIANDRVNTKEHTNIREDYHEADMYLLDRMDQQYQVIDKKLDKIYTTINRR